MCFKETEHNDQCIGASDACTNWSNEPPMWSDYYYDDTDERVGTCTYHWVIEQQFVASNETDSTNYIGECRICFNENFINDQCQGARNTCTGWSKTNPSWSQPFRDDTDGRTGLCGYSWQLQCR